MGGGKYPIPVQLQVLQKVYRTIYLNVRKVIGWKHMSQVFPISEYNIHMWKYLSRAKRGCYI